MKKKERESVKDRQRGRVDEDKEENRKGRGRIDRTCKELEEKKRQSVEDRWMA